MPPFIKNPFGKKGAQPDGLENQRPSTNGGVSLPGSKNASSINIRSKTEEPTEYKLSVYDSGVYLPPSPPEKKSFWPKSPITNGRSNHRSVLNENEPFSISRESFESYRRSFDISARSPVPQQDGFTPRQSFDLKKAARSPPQQHHHHHSLRRSSERPTTPPQTNEDGDGDAAFEDVGLNDDATRNSHPQQQKKRGIFSRFGDNNNAPAPETSGTDATRPLSSHRGFHLLPGRKRGQSGQGSELGNIERPLADKTNGVNVDDDGVVR